MFAFFKNLHIDLNVAIEKRESFDAVTDRETISVQNIDFFDVSIDKNSDENIERINDTLFERSRTTFDASIERDKIFDDVENEKIIDRDDEKDDEIIDSNDETEKIENETTNCSTSFDFFA